MKLPTISRVLVLIGALLMGGMYVLPLWRVDLGAPQYPEGLGLLIRVNTVEGQKPMDLRNINALNHYIGMRPIEPDAIPELRYMPWVLAGLIAFGVVTALVGRRKLLWGWLGTIVAAGAVGLYDFWRWGYDYGHNLDETVAIIKVPGMTYSPPVIGTKQLLNFTATSLPDAGAFLAGFAFLCGALALWLGYRTGTRFRGSEASAFGGLARPAAAGALLLVATLVSSCATSAAPIQYGEDSCAHCRMVITDPRFGGSVVTARGRTEQFDSIDCLVAFVQTLPEAPRAVLVGNFLSPGTMLPAEEAVFVRTASVHGPMGPGRAAVPRGSELDVGEASSAPSTYAELLASAAASRDARGHHHHHDAAAGQ